MIESILQEAERIIRERGEEYGDSDDCLGLVAAWWNYYMNYKVSEELKDADNPEWDGSWCYEELITPHDSALMMCMLKIARALTGKKKRDNYVDIAGYAALAATL